jgi:hypothetical protein
MWTYKAITKEEFDRSYNKHLPGAFLRFAFRYFSKSTEKKDMKVSRSIAWVLGGSFLVGFLGTVLNLPRLVIAIGTYALCAILVGLAVIILGGAWGNNLRLRKVRKILNVSRREYEWLVDKFYPEG